MIIGNKKTREYFFTIRFTPVVLTLDPLACIDKHFFHPHKYCCLPDLSYIREVFEEVPFF
jgi:hypothetical protein